MVARKTQRRNKSEKRGLGYAGVFAVIFLGILIVLGYNDVRIQRKRAELRVQAEELERRVGELQSQKEEAEARSLEAEAPEYQERILRERGLYKKGGEEVITILPPEPRETSQDGVGRVWWNPLTWF